MKESVFKLLESCEKNMESERENERKAKEPLLPKIHPGNPGKQREETMKKAYGNPTRKQGVGGGYFIDYKNAPNVGNRNNSRLSVAKGCLSAPARKPVGGGAGGMGVTGKLTRSTAKIQSGGGGEVDETQ